jgi:hypothetical protein
VRTGPLSGFISPNPYDFQPLYKAEAAAKKLARDPKGVMDAIFGKKPDPK